MDTTQIDPKAPLDACEPVEMPPAGVTLPVAAAPAVAGAGIRTILVAVDDTPSSAWASDFAARLAAGLGADLVLVHVVNPALGVGAEFVTTSWLSDMHREAAEMLQRVKSALPAGVRADTCVREGGSEQEIVAAARDWRADLIVLGTHGRGHLATFLLGSTAEGVVRRAHCPVVTVAHPPPGARARAAAAPATASSPVGMPQDVFHGMP